jgi:hypothetical protein
MLARLAIPSKKFDPFDEPPLDVKPSKNDKKFVSVSKSSL